MVGDERVTVPEEYRAVEDWFSAKELNRKLGFAVDSRGGQQGGDAGQASDDALNRFWSWITSGPQVQVPGPKALVTAPKYFRGQTKSWHGFTSSLYRVCERVLRDERVSENHLAAAERGVLAAMRKQGMGRRMTDGELLMICQHHQVPTRLIDVSMMPLEALYFAVEKEDGVDGRLFIVAPHCGSDELPNSREPLKLSQGQGNVSEGKSPLPWADAVRGVKQAHGGWSNEVRLVDEEPLDPRMRAQAGKFLVGGLHRAYRGLNMPGVDKDDRPKISNLAIHFNPPFSDGKVSQNWRATGWSVRIYAEWKSELRSKLAGLQETHGIENISENSMYPPIGQIGRLGKHVAETGMEATIAAAL